MIKSEPFPLDPNFEIRDTESLRALFGGTGDVNWAKSSSVLTDPMLRFIELSPFCCISSYDADGYTDVSPRGDAPGFVQAVERHTLLLPDRPGNQRFDTLRNIFESQQISLMFVIPGIFDTLRVNGRARVTRDPAILDRFKVAERPPKMVVVVTVEEAYGHCSKALRRSKLWTDDYRVHRDDAPSLADMIVNHLDINDQQLERLEYVIEIDAIHNQY